MPEIDPEISKLLPHRHPFLFVDKIISSGRGQVAQGIFRVPEDHPFVNRAGVNAMVLPPLLLVEAVGQVAAVCIRQQQAVLPAGANPLGYLARIEHCSFLHPVYAGEVVLLSAELVRKFEPLYKFNGTCEVAGRTVLEADFTIYFDPGLQVLEGSERSADEGR